MLEEFMDDALRGFLQDFRSSVESEIAEEFLQAMLNLMKLVYSLPLKYKENIREFQGRYQFLDRNRDITMAAIFDNGSMEVIEGVIDNPNITVSFRNGRTLMNYLLAPKQDVLLSMFRHDVQTEGNLNYLYRFGFMARQLQRLLPEI